MGIPHYPGHTLELGDFPRRPLRVTSGDQDSALRIGPVDAAHQLPDFGIRPGGDGAGVQNRHLAGRDVLYLLEAGFEQLPLEGGPVRLARAATEIEKLECGHGESQTHPNPGLPGWQC